MCPPIEKNRDASHHQREAERADRRKFPVFHKPAA
jgi:hypothetical protein